MSAVVVVAAVLLGLLAASCVRIASPGERLVVLRRCRIRRRPLTAVVLLVPGLEEVRPWPTRPVELLLCVRAISRDDRDVRVLLTIVLDIDPPRLRTAYVDPVRALRAVVEQRLTAVIEERTVDQLADRHDGVRAVLDGARLGGVAGGVVTDVVVDEVEVRLFADS